MSYRDELFEAMAAFVGEHGPAELRARLDALCPECGGEGSWDDQDGGSSCEACHATGTTAPHVPAGCWRCSPMHGPPTKEEAQWSAFMAAVYVEELRQMLEYHASKGEPIGGISRRFVDPTDEGPTR